MSMGLVTKTVGVVILAGVVLFFVQLCQWRIWFRQQMRKYNAVSVAENIYTTKLNAKLMVGQPTLPHSFLFGHLIVMRKVLAEYPGDLWVVP